MGVFLASSTRRDSFAGSGTFEAGRVEPLVELSAGPEQGAPSEEEGICVCVLVIVEKSFRETVVSGVRFLESGILED